MYFQAPVFSQSLYLSVSQSGFPGASDKPDRILFNGSVNEQPLAAGIS